MRIKELDHAPKVEFSQVVPPEKQMVDKGDPTRLRSKGNIQNRSRGQNHRPSPFFLSNPPINPCPKVSMISKQKYPTTP